MSLRAPERSRPGFCIGVNYHPSNTGCQYWQQWDAGLIEGDLRKIADSGFNTVRFFIFWADFEPQPGVYDEEKIEHLGEFVTISKDLGLYCLPSLLTIWMNGQLFDLPWRNGRDLWTDSYMVQRQIAFVTRLVTALKRYNNIYAYDIGDEIMHVDETSSTKLPRDVVAQWQQTLADVIRSEHPGSLVVQANEASAASGRHHFSPENSSALDMIAIHGFPVWTELGIESVSCYKSSSYVPFLVRYCRQYGSVLVDELGSYGCDDQAAGDYLRAVLPSTLANGACGVNVWCWQDFKTTEKPYALHPGERFVGLLDGVGRPKPSFVTCQAFINTLKERQSLTIPSAPIGIYMAESGNIPDDTYLYRNRSNLPTAFYTYLLLKRAHLPFEFTRGNFSKYRMIVCPSRHHITHDEQVMLMNYVAEGGVLYYSTAEYVNGFGGESLFGIRLRDFTRSPESMGEFTWQGQHYPVYWSADKPIPVIEETTATVLATYPNKTPAFTRHDLGEGTAFYLNCPFENQLNKPYRLYDRPWHHLHASIATIADIRRELYVDHPGVEIAELIDGNRRGWFLINHTPESINIRIHRDSAKPEVATLPAKDILVVECDTTSESYPTERPVASQPV